MDLKLNTYYKTANLLKIIGLASALITIVLLVILTIKKEQKIDSKDQELEDIRETVDPIIDSLQSIKIQEEMIESTVSMYLSYDNSENFEEIESIFSDTISKFYLKNNLPKEKVENEIKKHYARFPKSKFSYLRDNFIIKKQNGKGYKVLIEGVYLRDTTKSNSKEIIREISLNEKFRITSISDYYPEHYE